MNTKALLARTVDRLPYRWTSHLQRKLYRQRLTILRESVEHDLFMIPHLVRHGDTVIDIGANYGLWTHFFAAFTGGAGKVFAIEPVPRTFDILQHCAQDCLPADVRTVCVAVSDKDGRATISIPAVEGRVDYYRASLNNRHDRKNLHSYEVKTVSLDSLLVWNPEYAAPSMIKCDVEGHELAVVHGARKVVSESHPSWIIELDTDPDESGSDANQIKRYFESEGYGDYVFDDGCFSPRKTGDQFVNYTFIHESRMSDLPVR